MKVKDLIAKLQEFDQELEVTITDGFENNFYHTENLEIVKYIDFTMTVPVVDIGIGGNLVTEDKNYK